MYKVCSIFSQVLKLFSRGDFEQAVKEHKAERHARGFTSWGQFIAMLFCQVGRAHSLREICGGLACCEGHLKHLGVLAAQMSCAPIGSIRKKRHSHSETGCFAQGTSPIKMRRVISTSWTA